MTGRGDIGRWFEESFRITGSVDGKDERRVFQGGGDTAGLDVRFDEVRQDMTDGVEG